MLNRRRRLMRWIGMGVIGGGAAAVVDPLTSLLTLFEGDGESVALTRWDDASNFFSNYFFLEKLFNNIAYSYKIAVTYTPEVGDPGPRIQYKAVEKILQLRTSASTPALTFGGTGWTHTTNAGEDARYQSKGGRFSFNNAANCYFEYTSEDNTTGFYLLTLLGNTDGCAAIVAIDGDRTLADQLPTAQALVDASTLPDTILVANGGAFNPTDRVFEFYTNRNTHAVPIATGLTPGQHTIRITRTAHKHASATNTYILFQALAVSRNDLTLSDTGLYFYELYKVSSEYPVDEFAYNMQPDGTARQLWVGHTGSTKISEVPAFTAAGSAITPADQSTTASTELALTFSMSTYHQDYGGGTTSLGTVVITYTINPKTGLTITHSYTLDVGGLVGGFSSMMTTNETLDKCTYLEASQDYLLSENAGATLGNHEGKTWYAWDSDGNIAMLTYIPDLASVDNWSKSTNKYYFFDGGAGWNKAYAERFGGYTFLTGEVWSSTCNYRSMWFPDGADSALSKGA